MFICLFDFRKLWNSDISDFQKLQTPMFPNISHSFMYFTFHLWLLSFPLFHVIVLAYVLRSPLCTRLTLSHSLVYKYLCSVARTAELRLLLLFPSSHSSLSPLRDLEDPSLTPSLILVTRFQIQKFQSLEFPCSLILRNPGSLRDSTGNRAIPWVCLSN